MGEGVDEEFRISEQSIRGGQQQQHGSQQLHGHELGVGHQLGVEETHEFGQLKMQVNN